MSGIEEYKSAVVNYAVNEDYKATCDELHKALIEVQRRLENSIGKYTNHDKNAGEKEAALNDRDRIKMLHANFGAHYDQIKAELNTYHKRLGDEMQARKESELALESRIAEQRRQLQTKQSEMEHLANKVHLPVDADMLRLKIQKDLEARHRGDLELKSQEIERLQDQYYEAKRQLEVAKTQLETSRHESEKEFTELKDRMKAETSDLLIENQAL